ETVLPEMEAKEVPMQRPQTVPENKLASHPHLYKRSLAARQNKLRFERELGLERLKFRRHSDLSRVGALTAAPLDGARVTVEPIDDDPKAARAKLTAHLEQRIRDGARLLAQLLAGTAWGGQGSWREQGVVILLAGNSSRGEYVARALGDALGIENLSVW